MCSSDLTSPRRPDPRAVPFDGSVAAALANADPAALLAIDVDEAAALAVAGRASWQVLAGAAGDAGYTGELLLTTAPYGVAYHVATWALRISEASFA